MRTSLSSISLAWVANLLFLIIGRVEGLRGENVHKINRYRVELPEALSQLRGFLDSKISPEQRCQKYALMMKNMKSSPIDQFGIADLGVADIKSVAQQVQKLDLDTLRDLYIEGLESRREGPIDSSMFELYECLSNQFEKTDAKARLFLNEQRPAMAQYKSIMEQPLNFLLDEQVKHPSLTSQELLPGAYQTALALFDGSGFTVDSKFPKPGPEPAHQPEPEHQPEPAHQSEPEPEPKPTIEEPASPVADHHTSGLEHHNENASKLQQQQPASLLEPDADIPASLESELVQALNKAGMNPAFINHLARLQKALGLLHANLPADMSHDDRCRAYSEIIELEDIKETRISQIVEVLTTNGSPSSEPPAEPFVPDKEALDNFLWTLEKFSNRLLGPEVWVAMADCVALWADSHADAAAFMKSDFLDKTMKQIVDDAQEKAKQVAVTSGFIGENIQTRAQPAAAIVY